MYRVKLKSVTSVAELLNLLAPHAYVLKAPALSRGRVLDANTVSRVFIPLDLTPTFNYRVYVYKITHNKVKQLTPASTGTSFYLQIIFILSP